MAAMKNKFLFLISILMIGFAGVSCVKKTVETLVTITFDVMVTALRGETISNQADLSYGSYLANRYCPVVSTWRTQCLIPKFYARPLLSAFPK